MNAAPRRAVPAGRGPEAVEAVGERAPRVGRSRAGFPVLLSGHGDADLQKAAGGWVGVVVGYWLK